MTIDKKRQATMSRKQKLQHQKNMEKPVNRFLNSRHEDGTPKYEITEKLAKYFVTNPDPILDDARMCNALLHQVRWRKNNAVKYLAAYHQTTGTIDLVDGRGKLMTKDDCYLAYVSDLQNIHIALSRLRAKIVNDLLAKCDDVILTFDQYNQFVLKLESKVKELGYELFPKDVTLPDPL